MRKKEKALPRWLDNLKFLMEVRALNARRLSLLSGLNATAVRDMLDGRARYPRYDTVEALARTLDVTPAQLMSGTPESLKGTGTSSKTPLTDEDINTLVEIIARIQEIAAKQKHPLKPREFAAMITTIYRSIKNRAPIDKSRETLQPNITQLITYEMLRRRSVV